MVALEARCPDYAQEPLLWDSAFRQQLLDGLVELGYAVESAFDGQPQDIEGVWIDGRFAVVQSRPQIMHCAGASSGVGGGGAGGASSSAGRQRAKALAAADAAEAAAAMAAVRESAAIATAVPAASLGPSMNGSGEWEWER
jgi:hypothetical protein